MRGLLLAGSRSVWLREKAMRRAFVRRAVSRFMPGETLEDALGAARSLKEQKLSTILTCLGENVKDAAEAEAVARHYLDAIDIVSASGLDAEISVKLTQLGLELSPELAFTNLTSIASRAAEKKNRVWIDMEEARYTNATLAIFRRLRQERTNVGVCLQAYLRRTPVDLEDLLPLGPAIRLVKGAYLEPPELAFPEKSTVDANYFSLAQRLLSPEARSTGTWAAFGTHDRVLIRRITTHAGSTAVPRGGYEFELLYGIRTEEQTRLAGEGHRVRVLVSYGSYWFPWYMRRLAERPANVLFVAKSLLGA